MLRKLLVNYIEKAIKEAQKTKVLPDFAIPEIIIEKPENEKFGDYSTNVAMRIAPTIKRSSADVAELIKKYFSAKEFEKPEAIRGFVNFKIKPDYLIENLNLVLTAKEKFGEQKSDKTIVIDYSSPNIAKPFGIGHLRSTVIGDSLKRIYRKLGWKAIGINHLGDWGTQFGKLLVAYEKWGNKKELTKGGIRYLLDLYVHFHKEAEENTDLNQLAQKEFKKLEDGNEKNLKIWKLFKETSIKEFDRIYQDLGVKLEIIKGESEYNKEAKTLTTVLLKKKLATKSEGAVVIELPDPKIPPLLLEKADGATLYSTRDLVAAIDRYHQYKFDLMIYNVGNEQSLHFKQLFLALEKLGYMWVKNCKHISHGLYRFKEGRMSTRKGKIIFMEDVIKEAIEKSTKIIAEKNPDLKNKEEVAKKIAIGAIKYNDLAQNRRTDIVFDWEKMLNFNGDSGPYLQYTYTRIQSIIRKSGVGVIHELPRQQTRLDKPEEIDLLRDLIYFPETIENAAALFEPNLIATYLNQLAQKFNLFYNKLPVLKAPDEIKNSRLKLIAAVAIVIKNGLDLLGIETVEEM